MNFRLLMLGLSAVLFVGNAVADGPCWADERCVRITGVGLAAVRPDDERPHNLKQLAAIRAAKLEAIRSLAEQAHGVTLQSRSQSEKSEMGTDSIVVESGATLKGVRFIRVEPVESGIYQAVAELDVRY
jgi:hypothetical protein